MDDRPARPAQNRKGSPLMALPVGTNAPEFTLPDANRTPVSLSSYRGKQAVLLVFYPFAFSGTCTTELCAIRDDLGSFENDDVQVLAISTDPVPTLKAWSQAQSYTFPLLSDFWPHGEVAKAYDVFFDKAGMAVRGTFLVDTKGVIQFSEANGPGEARDQSAWKRAVAALPARAH
jgi:peroxiredoxin